MSKVMAAIIFASHIEYWTIIKWGKTITTYLVIIITKRGELRYSRVGVTTTELSSSLILFFLLLLILSSLFGIIAN